MHHHFTDFNFEFSHFLFCLSLVSIIISLDLIELFCLIIYKILFLVFPVNSSYIVKQFIQYHENTYKEGEQQKKSFSFYPRLNKTSFSLLVLIVVLFLYKLPQTVQKVLIALFLQQLNAIATQCMSLSEKYLVILLKKKRKPCLSITLFDSKFMKSRL